MSSSFCSAEHVIILGASLPRHHCSEVCFAALQRQSTEETWSMEAQARCEENDNENATKVTQQSKVKMAGREIKLIGLVVTTRS